MDTPEESALTADVFEALDLSPEQFLTDGGLVNRGKLRAALWYPHDYLPEGHWMRAADEVRLRAENARLAREAHTWWTAARDALKLREPLAPEVIEAAAAEAFGYEGGLQEVNLGDLLHFARVLEQRHGIGA